jgi:uncharacterized protein (TIGR02001 family)
MKTAKKVVLRSSVLAVALASVAGVVAPASADVTAAASVANMYLWRGQDLGGTEGGVPAVSGEVRYSQSGFYTGIWGSSGDSAFGTEYDLFAGYGGEVSGFKYDLSLWNYMYPSSEEGPTNGMDDFGGLTDAVLTLGVGPVSFSYYDNIAGGGELGGATGNEYYTLSVAAGSFAALLGYQDPEEADGATFDKDYAHLDLSYAFNDRIKFTLSQIVDADEENNYDEDLKFVVGYSLPIDIK